MAGNENLIPFRIRSADEAREKGRRGGKASGEARRRKKTLRESMKALLDLPIYDAQSFNEAARFGIPLEDLDNGQLIVIALFKRAAEGDVAAIKELRNWIGEDTDADGGIAVNMGGEASGYAD